MSPVYRVYLLWKAFCYGKPSAVDLIKHTDGLKALAVFLYYCKVRDYAVNDIKACFQNLLAIF